MRRTFVARMVLGLVLCVSTAHGLARDTYATTAMRIERGELAGREGRFSFAADAEPSDVVLDPNIWMLMEPPAFVKRER